MKKFQMKCRKLNIMLSGIIKIVCVFQKSIHRIMFTESWVVDAVKIPKAGALGQSLIRPRDHIVGFDPQNFMRKHAA